MVIEVKNEKIAIVEEVMKYLPERISEAIYNLDKQKIDKLCEIRFRSDLPVVLVFTDCQRYITDSGRITSFSSAGCLIADEIMIKNTFSKMCRYSVYAYSDQLRKGYLSLSKGIRVGVYGVAVADNDEITSIRSIRGLNIRIPGCFVGVSDVIDSLYIGNRIPNLLICGPPSSGKTTLLKDLCRNLSDKYCKRISVIDERFEFEYEFLGINTDVLSGYPKNNGIEIAVRTLSPEIIVFDELGMGKEIDTVVECLNCGVKFVMSLHCSDKAELFTKRQYIILSEKRAVDFIVFLEDKCRIKRIYSIEELENEGGCIDVIGNKSCNDRTISCVQT